MADPFFVIASTVDGTAVFDGGVVADGREAVVPGFGARPLCAGSRYIVMGSEHKYKSREDIRAARRRDETFRSKRMSFGEGGGWMEREGQVRSAKKW